MLKGFRDFILRGNVVDMAVGVVIGVAFGAVVSSLVADIINPLISSIVGKPDFSFLKVVIHGGVIKFGSFLNAVISFIIIAAVIYFFVVLPVNYLMKKFMPKKAAPTTTRACPECLSQVPLEARRCAHCAQPIAPVANPAS